MTRPQTDTGAADVTDRDRDHASERRRLLNQLLVLAEAARRYRDIVLTLCPAVAKSSNARKLLDADTELRDALTIVARMRRFN